MNRFYSQNLTVQYKMKINQMGTYSKKASCPPDDKNFCNIRWYGNFFSSKSMGAVNPMEQMKKVMRRYGEGKDTGGSQDNPPAKSFVKADATERAAGDGTEGV